MVMWLRVLVTSVQGRVVLPVGTSSTSQQTLMCWNTLVDQVTHTHDLDRVAVSSGSNLIGVAGHGCDAVAGLERSECAADEDQGAGCARTAGQERDGAQERVGV